MAIYLPKKYKQRIGVKVTSDTSEMFLRKVLPKKNITF